MTAPRLPPQQRKPGDAAKQHKEEHRSRNAGIRGIPKGRKQPVTPALREQKHREAAEDAQPASRPAAQPRARASSRQSMGEAFAKSLLRQAGSTIARELMRGIMGSLKKR